MKTAPLRVGLAGAGMVSAHHLAAWRALGDAVRVVAIADPDLERARRQAERFGIARVHPSVAGLLHAERLDALDVATPPHAHADACRAAAAAGVAVLCQKPLAPTLDEARRLAADVEPRVRLMVHENWRFRPHYRLMRRWLDDGAIGALQHGAIAARSSGLLAGADGRRPALVRQPLLATLPRLIVGEVLVHHVDIACWLGASTTLAAAELRRDVASIAGESAAALRLGGDDADAGAGGVPFDIDGDMADARCGPVLRDTVRLTGRDGVIALADGRLELQGRQRAESLDVDLDADYAASYAATIAHFVDALRRDAPFETPPAWHLHVLAIVDAFYRRAG